MKKRIITSALALALAFSLCACTDNTSTTESYSDSTSGTVVSSETASFAQSGDSVLLPESGYETSKPNQANETLKGINIYDYIPVGYVDEAQRYLLLKANADNSLNDYTCDYVVYDDREKKAVYHFTVGGYYDPASESQPFDSDVKYSEGMFSFSAWNYYVDTDECERWYEVTDVYGNLIYKSTTSKTQISHCTYVPSDDKVSIRDPSNQRGIFPLFAERLLKELRKPQTDWRKILNDFIQEEIVDYSFTPPDRRFDDSPFFLPDFNDKDTLIKDILFMIDTSGSMSDNMITAAYSEVKGAIDQFDGKLKGWLGFFDAAIIEPKLFTSPDEFKIIKPAGGGGTDFQIIFEYVHIHMQDKLPASIIILTDGYAPFPKEKLAGGIPVLWLLNNEEVNPPWGKIARIVV